VNKGLILAADNEAELAGVMAHETGHVAARHAMEMKEDAGIDYGMLRESAWRRHHRNVLYNGADSLRHGFLKFSRAAEEEADRLGVIHVGRSYDPNAMAHVREAGSQEQKETGHARQDVYRSSGSADRRASAIACARFPSATNIHQLFRFQRVKNRLLRLSNGVCLQASHCDSDDGTPGRRL